VILRGVAAAVAAAALAGALLIPRPDVFALTMPAGLLLVVLSAGLAAAAVIPVRRRALAAAALTGVAGLLLLARLPGTPLAAVALLAQALPHVPPRRPARSRC
jgi:hypothetical protein